MKRMILVMAAGLALGLLAGLAQAMSLSEPQKNAIENIAQVIAGSGKCDDWALNERLAAQIQVLQRWSINNPDVYAYVESRVTFHADRIKDRTREDICEAIGRLYGPQGNTVPDLAIKVK